MLRHSVNCPERVTRIGVLMPRKITTSKIERICQYCGKTFSVLPFLINHSGAKYCSQQCQRLQMKSAAPKVPIEIRFWKKVKKTDSCWLWTGAKVGWGYGVIGLGSKRDGLESAHRLSWTLHHGPIPVGLNVLHNCPDGDRPDCVNPAHLWLGTLSDNSRDMVRKGRYPAITDPERHGHGEDYRATKFTDESVRKLRERYAVGGVTYLLLANEFGVSDTTIAYIIKRKTWKHVA